MSESELESMLLRLRVSELKTLLRNHAQKVSGNKVALVTRLLKYAERSGSPGDLLQAVKQLRQPLGAMNGGRAGQMAGFGNSSSANAVMPSFARAGAVSSSTGYGNLHGHLGLPQMPPTGPDIMGMDVFGGQSDHADAFMRQSLLSLQSHPPQPATDVFEEGARVLRQVAESDPFHEMTAVLYDCSVITQGHDFLIRIDMTHHAQSFNRLHPDTQNHRVLVYCTNLKAEREDGRPKHMWPPAIGMCVNSRPVEIVQQCVDGRHRNKALLERPCNILPRLSFRENNSIKYILPHLTPEEQSRAGPTPPVWVASVVLAREVSPEAMMASMKRKSADESLKSNLALFGDGEVECEDMVISLRDPVLWRRIHVPAKTVFCTHAQCFDAENFFTFQRKAKNAKWRCFVCDKKVHSPSEIVIDSWFENVLWELAEDEEASHIELLKDGTWRVKSEDADEQKASASGKRKRESPAKNGEEAASSAPSESSAAAQDSAPLAAAGGGPADCVVLVDSDEEEDA